MFVIVKNAGPECQNRWVGNPVDGIHHSFSCHNTVTGKHLGIKPSYQDKNEAEIDCQRANHSNPCGYYAVCPVLEPEATPAMIRDTAENWENGTLGQDECFAQVVHQSEKEIQAINDCLGLKPISLLLEEELFKAYKEEAVKRGLGHKTLMRIALKQFLGYQSDQDEILMSENKTNATGS